MVGKLHLWMHVSIWREKCYCRFVFWHCQFVVVDVVEHLRQVYVEAIDYDRHHWSGCVEGSVIAILDQLDFRSRYWKVGQILIEERWRPAARSVVIGDSAVHVESFDRRPCWAGWKVMCVSILGSRSSSSVLSAGHRRLILRKSCQWCCPCRVLGSGMIIALCHNSGWIQLLWIIWPIVSLIFCRQAWNMTFLLIAANGIAARAVFWTNLGQKYWWWCGLMDEFIGYHLGSR